MFTPLVCKIKSNNINRIAGTHKVNNRFIVSKDKLTPHRFFPLKTTRKMQNYQYSIKEG